MSIKIFQKGQKNRILSALFCEKTFREKSSCQKAKVFALTFDTAGGTIKPNYGRGGVSLQDKYPVNIIRSRRKTYSIEVAVDGSVTVRVPWLTGKRQVEKLLREKADWIERKRRKMAALNERAKQQGALSPEDLAKRTLEAQAVLPRKVAFFAEQMGVSYQAVRIRHQKTRWGSCSSKGNINLNALLMCTPEHVQDYVVVHELCHLKQMNHSPLFWQEVAAVLPDYKKSYRWLKENGNVLMERMKK